MVQNGSKQVTGSRGFISRKMSITTLLTKLEVISTHCTRKKGECDIKFFENWKKFKEITSLKCRVRNGKQACPGQLADSFTRFHIYKNVYHDAVD